MSADPSVAPAVSGLEAPPRLPPPAAPGALVALARRGARWLRRQLNDPERPLVAVEVRPRSVGVVRLGREGGRTILAAAASVDLPPGTIDMSMLQANVADAEGFRRALRGALERAGVLDGARIGLVLPDPVARVALLPAGEVTGNRTQAEELIRFRLRKSVPFDIREAQLAFSTDGARTTDSVLVVAIHRPVLDGYEQACRSAGLEPGLVELSGLALLSADVAASPGADRLLVNWDEGYVTIMLARGEWPLLVRTLTGEAASQPQQVVREVEHTALYYRERLGGPGLAQAGVRSAVLPAAQAASLLSDALQMPATVLEPWRSLALDMPEPISQALAGAAASLTAVRA